MQIIEDIKRLLDLKLAGPSPDCLQGLHEKERPWANLFCQIAAVEKWEYLLQIHLALLFVINEGLERLSLARETRLAILTEVKSTMQNLANEYKRLNPRQQNRAWPKPNKFKTRLPRYAFLSAGYTAEKRKSLVRENFDDLPETFKSICWDVITGFIALERQPSTGGHYNTAKLASISFSLRTLIDKNPNIRLSNLKTLIENEDVAIAALSNYRITYENDNDYHLNLSSERIEYLHDKFIDRNMKNLVAIYQKKTSHGRPNQLLLSRSQKAWQKRDKNVNSSIAKIGNRPILTGFLANANIKGGVAPSELEKEILIGEYPDTYSYKMASNALTYQNEEATAWSKSVPGYQLLAKCYERAFHSKWSEMQPLQRLAAFKVMVYLHVGILPGIFNDIKVGRRHIGKKLLQKEGIYIDVDRLCFTSLLPIQIDPETLLANPKWEDRGLVEIPLPPLLRQMLQDLLSDFPANKSGALWIPEKIKVSNILPDKVSTKKLIGACERYYVKRYGLEPELLSLIAGRPVLRRASSIHYFCTNYQRLRDDYHTAYSTFHSDILKACGNSDIEHRLPEIGPNQTQQAIGEIGSAIFPKLSDLSQYLENLRARLRQIEQAPFPEFRQWREVLTLYVWEVLKISTGMRAMRRPPFNRYSIIPNLPLRLSDKGSGWRLVPVHSLAVKLVRMLVNANQRLWTSRRGKLPYPPEEEIFFVEADGVKRPLAHSTVVSTADNHGIAYPKLKPNYQRHLMRSWLHEMGVSHRITDAVLGHKQGGPDALDNQSLIPMVQIQRCFLPAVDALFTRLDITMVHEWRR